MSPATGTHPLFSELPPSRARKGKIVSYDDFTIYPDILDAYTEIVKGLVDQYYLDVTR